MITGKTLDTIEIGETAETSKTIGESDVYLYAGITGDFNPAHINEAYASQTGFGTRIAHGMLPAGLISAVLANRLPGPGTIYISQSLKFTAPVRIGDTITARVEVIEVDRDKKRVRLKTICTNQDGTAVIEGEAVVSPPRRPRR
ncbi:MAG: MaoC family dehydratase [Desulfobacterales bacterium]